MEKWHIGIEAIMTEHVSWSRGGKEKFKLYMRVHDYTCNHHHKKAQYL
jgi:hypothetical protein